MKWIRHTVADMDESMVQRCVICGEIISDYTNGAWSKGDQPKGFAAGSVYIGGKNPTVFKTDFWQPPTEFNECFGL